MQIFATIVRRRTPTAIEPLRTHPAMSSAVVVDLIFVALVFGAVLFWIFVSPVRARKRRHQEMYGQTGHFQAWDPNIGARKRERH